MDIECTPSVPAKVAGDTHAAVIDSSQELLAEPEGSRSARPDERTASQFCALIESALNQETVIGDSDHPN